MKAQPSKAHQYPEYPSLGLVCTTADETIRFRQLTRTRLLRLSVSHQQAILRELYENNMLQLEKAINYCAERQIHLYRVYSFTFPFFDTAIGKEELLRLASSLKRIGHSAHKKAIRIVSHPDQFVVLNSDRSEVVENSIKILEAHAFLFDLLAQPRSPWSACNIHPGKANRKDRLLKVIDQLPNSIRSRLTLENDEYSYNAEATYKICIEAGIPMVFDAHHHVISEKCASYDDISVKNMFLKARETWAPNEEWQLVHIANGSTSFHDRAQHDFVTALPNCFKEAHWIEIEANKKELAIDKVRDLLGIAK